MNVDIILYFLNEDENFNEFNTTAPLLKDFKIIEVSKMNILDTNYIFIKINCLQDKIGDILYLLRNVFKFQINILCQLLSNKTIKECEKAHELNLKTLNQPKSKSKKKFYSSKKINL